MNTLAGAFFKVRSSALLLLVSVTLGAVGCQGSGSGQLSIRSATESVALRGGFDRGVYSFDDNNNLTALLFDGPAEAPTQAVTIRVFWKPRAGRTPIDPAATNATIHYIIFTGEDRSQVGVYSGAGFVFPNTKPGKDSMTAGVWESTLRLADRSDQFRDLLGQAMLEGKFKVVRDELRVNQMLRDLNVQVTQRLGYPRLVDTQRGAGVALGAR